MVFGLDHFGQRLSAYKEHFVLVGGSAADLLMTEIGGDFRATKDLDIVVFMRPDPAFLKALAEYIRDGEYENKEKGEGVSQFYRFNKPKKNQFPKQIELFSKKPEDLNLFDSQHIIPIQKIEVGSQFSGILLEDEYYELIKANMTDGEHANYITAVAQIPLKARAFNELRERKAKGVDVKDNDIKKHRNDILILTGALIAGENYNLIGLPRQHLEIYLQEMVNLENDQGVLDVCRKSGLGKPSEIITAIRTYYF